MSSIILDSIFSAIRNNEISIYAIFIPNETEREQKRKKSIEEERKTDYKKVNWSTYK